MVLNEIFFRKGEGGRLVYYNPADIELKVDDKGNRISAVVIADGRPVESAGIGTMSKSKNNGVDPQALIEQYGADIARFFVMFTSPPEQTLEWSDSGVEGSSRFLRRVWAFGYEVRQSTPAELPAGAASLSPELASARREIHAVLKQANYDMSRHQFNTVASAGMKILNALESAQNVGTDAALRNTVLHEGFSILLRLLSPIAPHVSHQLWRDLGYGKDIVDTSWPEHDPAALVEDEIELIVQVNGKKRGTVRVPRDADRDAIEAIVLANPSVEKFVGGQPIKKVVVVPGRLVNVVV
jgi:leucyl-tRNA synthetase